MLFPVGANVQAYAVDDWGVTLDYYQKLAPAVMTVSINSLNDKNRIFEAQQAWKQTLVIARFILTVDQDGEKKELDGALHTKPQAPGDNNTYLVSPVNYFNLIEPMAENGAVLYWMNEPSGEVDADTYKRLVDHTLEGIALADERKRNLCVLNWGVGHPLLTNNNTELDARLEPILRALVTSKRQHYWGMHLYAPADTYGRLEALEGICTRLKIDLPKIVITEFGFDAGYGGDVLDGYVSRKIPGDKLADFTSETIRNKWRRLIEGGHIVGVTPFAEGGNPRWENFNFANDKAYKDRLMKIKTSGELNLTIKRTTSTIPKYFPNVKPISSEYPMRYRVELPKGVTYRNFRVLPEEASDKTGAIHTSDIITLYDFPSETDSLMRKWQWMEVVEGESAGLSGWLYVGGILLIPVLPNTPSNSAPIPVVTPPPWPPVVQPEPAPEPIPQPPVTPLPVGLPETFNTTLSRDQWVKVAEKMRAIQASIGDLASLIESFVSPVVPEGVRDV